MKVWAADVAQVHLRDQLLEELLPPEGWDEHGRRPVNDLSETIASRRSRTAAIHLRQCGLVGGCEAG